MTPKATILACILAAIPFAAPAQTMTVEELRALVDERVAGVDGYRALLDDPDPARSMAAMEIMLGSDDLALKRMALDQGLYSPNPVVRRMALEAFFNSGPTLAVTFDATAVEGDLAPVLNRLNGSLGPDGKGFAAYQVGPFDAEKGCWLVGDSQYCLASLSDTSLSVRLFNDWGAAQLRDDGIATGFINMDDIASVPFSFPVSN